MSFGLKDEDWVDPEEHRPILCRDCEYWEQCPCGCNWGWCTDFFQDFTRGDDGCGDIEILK